jgi:hypothetical protein
VDGRDKPGHDDEEISAPPHGRLKNSTQFGFLPVA